MKIVAVQASLRSPVICGPIVSLGACPPLRLAFSTSASIGKHARFSDGRVS